MFQTPLGELTALSQTRPAGFKGPTCNGREERKDMQEGRAREERREGGEWKGKERESEGRTMRAIFPNFEP